MDTAGREADDKRRSFVTDDSWDLIPEKRHYYRLHGLVRKNAVSISAGTATLPEPALPGSHKLIYPKATHP